MPNICTDHTCDLWNIYRIVFLCCNSGQPGGKLAWYINGLLVPELTLTRGERYTFKVYGGSNDGATMEGYHPFYITNSPTGGRLNNPSQVSGYIIDHAIVIFTTSWLFRENKSMLNIDQKVSTNIMSL